MQEFRKEYKKLTLSEADCPADPVELFNVWFQDAVNAGLSEPNAMALATVSPQGMPSVRVVLLKAVEGNGFVFFTNYNSRKGIHLSNNSKASLLFFWKEIERQVRIQGIVEKTSDEYADKYFDSRPFESKAAAIVSRQSQVISARKKLEEAFHEISQDPNQVLVRPEYWGGYILKPLLIEFWQGREHRLHDRIQYRLADNTWIRERLAP